MTNSRDCFLGLSDSLETSREILEEIFQLANGSESVAMDIWEVPSRYEVEAIKRGLSARGIPFDSVCWGDEGSRWWKQ